MDINSNLAKDLVPNEHKFTDDFFQQFSHQQRNYELALNDEISKNYQFPTFYADASCSIAIFHCDYQAAKNMMPSPSMKPVKMTKGRSLVIFSCYEYRNVMNIAPYNEIAMTIPVITDNGLNIPIISMLLGDMNKKFGYYVFNMPVTSKENQIRGREIWGLPKNTECISIHQKDGFSFITSAKENEAPYFELTLPTEGSTQKFDVKSSLFSTLNNERLKSTTQFKGEFTMNKNISSLFNKPKNENSSLILGEGEMADKLRSLKIENTAFQYRYCSSLNASFDLPSGHTKDR